MRSSTTFGLGTPAAILFGLGLLAIAAPAAGAAEEAPGAYIIPSNPMLSQAGSGDAALVNGSASGYASQSDMAEAFGHATGGRVDVIVGDEAEDVGDLAAREYVDVLMWTPIPGITLKEALSEKFKDPSAQPTIWTVGQFAIFVVVNRHNPVQQLSIQQLRDIFSGHITDWSKVGAGKGKISMFGEDRHSKGHEIFTNKMFDAFGGFRNFAASVVELDNCDAVAAAVAKDYGAIGYCLYRQQPIEGIKAVAVGDGEKGPFHQPTDGNVFTHLYPLAEDLSLVTCHGARKLVTDYCRFSIGPEGAKIAKDCYLYADYDRQVWFAKQRVAEVKSGKGAAVSVVGYAREETLAKELALKYVEEREVVQVHYRKQASQADAVREILDGKVELLLVEGEATDGLAAGGGQDHPHPGPLPPREREVEKELDKKCKRVVVGQAALGVVVHPKTLLKSLSMEELRQVFCGQIKNWPSAGKGVGPAIHGYGLRSDSPVMEIYKRMLLGKGAGARGQGVGEAESKGAGARGQGVGEAESKGAGAGGQGLEEAAGDEAFAGAAGAGAAEENTLAGAAGSGAGSRALKLTAEADTQKVLLAVARDPDGIGLVDLSQMPKDDKSVTLLAIDLGKGRGEGKGAGARGQGAEKATPAAGDVPEGYPLVQACVLYVSPEAGDAAKNFFTWLAAAGANGDRGNNGGANDDHAELLARFGLLPGRKGRAASDEGRVEQPGEVTAPAGDVVATLGKEPQIDLEEPRAAASDAVDEQGGAVTLPRRRNFTAKDAKDAKKKTAAAETGAADKSSAEDAADPADSMKILLGFAAIGGIISVVAVGRVKRRKAASARQAGRARSRPTQFASPDVSFNDSIGSIEGGGGRLANDRGPAAVQVEKTFDPYHVWLSIPPQEQPPNHYRLLGLAALESDREVIEEAADRQMAHLRTFQLGQYAALSQELLGEVSAAKGCLLSPTKKPIYDAHLRRRLAAC